jgi:hypothetical protein
MTMTATGGALWRIVRSVSGRGVRSSAPILWLVPVWVAVATITVNATLTPIIGFSHGFHENTMAVSGWPLIYCREFYDVPQGTMNGQPWFVSFEECDWFSSSALLFNVAASLIVVAGTGSVTRKVVGLLKARTFSLSDLFWALCATGIGAAIFVKWEAAPGIAQLLGADTAEPRLATMAWYSAWVRVGLSVGMVGGVLMAMSIALSAIRFAAVQTKLRAK